MAVGSPRIVSPGQQGCQACGGVLPVQMHQGQRRKWCSESCRAWGVRNPGRRRDEPRSCRVCGCDISARPLQARTCAEVTEDERRTRRLEAWRRKNRRRRGGISRSESYTLAQIAARDGHRCGLCRLKVDMLLVNPDPMAPTIDHVVPLSISGDDTRANVQLAHRRCNVAKGARGGGEQLALLG